MGPRSIAALVASVAVVAGCGLSPRYDDTHFRCPAESPDCPAGFTCVAGTCERVGPDAPTTGDGAPDATADVCTLAHAAPNNDLCSGAIDVTTAARAGGATVYGDTTGYASNLNPAIIATCTGAMNPGPDAIYRVDANAGDTLTVTLTPTDWDGAVYVLDGCSGSAGCLGGDDQMPAGSIDTADIPITTAGTYYVVVDSQQPSRAGCFTLNVAL